MSPTDHPPKEVEGNDSDKQFRLSRAWVVIGLLAIALGIGCGLVMSSATFLR
jgi:hypothetical protein